MVKNKTPTTTFSFPPLELLSVVMPLYNEAATIDKILDAVLAVQLVGGLAIELILVDDCSSDGSAAAVERYMAAHP